MLPRQVRVRLLRRNRPLLRARLPRRSRHRICLSGERPPLHRLAGCSKTGFPVRRERRRANRRPPNQGLLRPFGLRRRRRRGRPRRMKRSPSTSMKLRGLIPLQSSMLRFPRTRHSERQRPARWRSNAASLGNVTQSCGQPEWDSPRYSRLPPSSRSSVGMRRNRRRYLRPQWRDSQIRAR